jgi:hypothetical protein
VSVIVEMKRKKKQGQWSIDDVYVVVGTTTLLLSISWHCKSNLNHYGGDAFWVACKIFVNISS